MRRYGSMAMYHVEDTDKMLERYSKHLKSRAWEALADLDEGGAASTHKMRKASITADLIVKRLRKSLKRLI